MPGQPIDIFRVHIRPAYQLLKLYRLLDTNDTILRTGALVDQLRILAGVKADSEILVIHHPLLTGLIQEDADLRETDFKRRTLKNLLRQSVVVACTALDAYLPALLRAHLPTVIARVGRSFFPTDDKRVKEYFKNITFTIDDVLRVHGQPAEDAATYVAGKLLASANTRFFGTTDGIHVTGRLLQIQKPWDEIAARLGKDLDAKTLETSIDATFTRRHDVVHRADRHKDTPDSESQQEIELSETQTRVDRMNNLCMALQELVEDRLKFIETLPMVLPGAP